MELPTTRAYTYDMVWNLENSFIIQELVHYTEQDIWSEQTQILWEQAQQTNEKK